MDSVLDIEGVLVGRVGRTRRRPVARSGGPGRTSGWPVGVVARVGTVAPTSARHPVNIGQQATRSGQRHGGVQVEAVVSQRARLYVLKVIFDFGTNSLINRNHQQPKIKIERFSLAVMCSLPIIK